MTDDEARPAPSHAAVLGHPIHPMLVPLPIGALVGALASDLVYMRTRDASWARASTMLLGAGLATGAAAAPFGALDFASIRRARQHPEGWIHAAGNVAALALTAGNLALRLRGDRRAVLPAALALSATTAAIIGLTGWMGGELSYRYRVGVMADEAASGSAPASRRSRRSGGGRGGRRRGRLTDDVAARPPFAALGEEVTDDPVPASEVLAAGLSPVDLEGFDSPDGSGLVGDVDALPADDAAYENVGGIIRATGADGDA